MKTVKILRLSILGLIWLWFAPRLQSVENPHRDQVPTLLRFAAIPVPDSNRIPVEFDFYHTLAAGDSGVGINGSFNGWGDVYKCQNMGNNLWRVVLYLNPGRYQYKFVTYTDTVGQAGVTGWYTDALNPDYTGPYRDSFITVSDPMIYYFMPVRDTEINDQQPLITAKISHAQKTQLVLNATRFGIDGQELADPWNYLDPLARNFQYEPPEKLVVGVHTLTLTVANNQGQSRTGQTNFTIVKGIVEAPLELIFDGRSPFLELTQTVHDVKFEWMDEPVTHELAAPAGDGIFSRTIKTRVNKNRFYRVIVNADIYLENDPTNPEISDQLRSIVRKVVDPQPRVIDFSPLPGTIFIRPDSGITFSARVVPSDSEYAILPGSLQAWLDEKPVALTIIPGKDTISVHFAAQLPVGRHVVRYTAQDESGQSTHPAAATYGVMPGGHGAYFVDPPNDDNGAGSYLYPTNIPANSADIWSLQIQLNPTLDSLNFNIGLAKIADNTRIGLVIANQIKRKLIEAPEELELRLPDWNEAGVLMILAAPQSALFRASLDNQVLYSSNPVRAAFKLQMNPDAASSGQFRFRLAIADLEKYLGSYNQKWYFTAYSYLVTNAGSFEITRLEGGVNDLEEPDVYDLAFCEGAAAQSLLLKNYITPIKIGGPRLAAIGTEGRGTVGLAGTELDPTFVPAPVVKLLAQGGKIYWDSVRVVGTVSDPTITEAILQVNNQEFLVPVQQQLFEKTIQLTAGINRVLARVQYHSDRVSQSLPVEYQYMSDRSPVVKITVSNVGQTVTLDGSQTFSPVGANLSYSWRADETNPQPVTLSNRTSAITTLELPATPGEYYFTLTVRAGVDAGWGRTVVVVDDSARFKPIDPDTWHPAWVDRMILYEIFVRTYSVTGKLSAVQGRMSMLKDLGVNCLWFMPLHPSPSTHGYWITDYYDIHPDYGTLEDFRKVVNEAHKYGIKVVLDLVINHTVDTHLFMRDALENGIYSPYRDFYHWNADGTFQYLYTWVNLPSINFSTPWVQDYLINMCKWWVQKYNVDGFRCDVAHAIEERRPEGPAFWQRWRRELKAVKPDLFLLAEAAASDPRYFDKKFDSAYDYWFYSEIRNALSATSGADNLNRVVEHYLNQVPEAARPMRYLENHDESRFLNSFSVAQTKVAAALTFTLPGIPLIYAGQEVGDLSSRGLVNWNDANQLKPFYKKLIEIRSANIPLMTGEYVYVPAKNQNVYAFLRRNAAQTFLIVANLASTAQSGQISMAIADLPGDTTTSFYLNDALTSIATPVTGADLLHWPVNLTPNQISIYEFSKTPTGVNSQSVVPDYFGLDSNYPNPFNAGTQIRYHIGGVQMLDTKLDIYNVLGQRVRTLVHKPLLPGNYQVIWDGQNDHGDRVSSGIYLCQLQTEGFTRVIKMLVLK